MLKNKFKPVGTIYETTDYDAFTLLDFNRDAKPRKDLLDALDENGRFYEHIIVNEDLEVLDGQHRLLSAKLKNKPITFYIVDEGASKEIIKSVNTKRKNWTLIQYIEFYSRLGYEEYQTLEGYIKSELSKSFSITTIHEVLSGKQGTTKFIKEGNFKVDNIRKSDVSFEYLKTIAVSHGGRLKVKLGRTVLSIEESKTIDSNRLLTILLNPEVYKRVNVMQDRMDMTDYLMSVYNKGLTKNYVEYYFDKRGKFQTI